MNWLEDFLASEDNPSEAGPARPATIAICSRDRPNDLERCLVAIHQLPSDGQEVLVIDSFSKSDETHHVVAARPGVRYLREERPGLNRARNRALQEAINPIVAFCDDDAVPEAGWLRAITSPFADPAVYCVTGLTMPAELVTPAQEWFELHSSFSRGFRRKVHDKSTIHPMGAGRAGAGANMALRREALSIFGPFDEALDAGTPTHSGGDSEMFSRILAAGYRIAYEPAALSWHHHRREWKELVRTIYGYGVGVYAWWTKKLLYEGETSVLYLAADWLLKYQLPSMLRSPNIHTFKLLAAELAGCLAGPWAYLRSRRQYQ
jgi:cellulose synthase/poly-beta-1,6-N-acetylglucosamine synthase-like glycosyltransferase